MPLTSGSALGPYQIIALIGEGGMGQVYKAHDTRVGRDVAIKIAGEAFTERFTREAQAIAALNHSNVCHLYDVGPNYLVLEYVEGDTLRGPMAFEDALPLIRQIIDGIEAAHEKHIIHRDLKPANIKVTPEGVVKILDFGLAKLPAVTGGQIADRETPASFAPTITTPAMTQQGMILGTAAYMAPEQAKGKPADTRSDIWAFGVIVYELLTGQRLFGGETSIETLGEVLHKTPELSSAPPRARMLLGWCLERERKNRLQAIGDARRLFAHEPLATGPPSPPTSAKHRAALPVAAAIALAVGASAAWSLKPVPASDQAVMEFEIAPPEGTSFGPFGQTRSAAVSPDGRQVVLVARGPDGKRRLWLRPLRSSAARVLPGTDNAVHPFWSPDSRFVGFGSGGRLWRTAVDGGQLQAIAETATGLASFRGDGMVLFSDVNKPLQRISGLGQPPSPALELDAGRGEIAQNAPQFLPDGNRFLYVSNGNNVSVMLGSLDGGASRVLFSEAGSPAYYAADADAERGWLLSSLNTGGTRQLVARPFDAATGQVVGEPLPIADALNAGPIWSASDTGILMFRRFRPSQAQYAWFSRSGSRLGVVGEPGTLGRPRLSGDQQSLAFSRTTGGNSDIWLLDLAKGISRRFTLEPGADSNPVWSADGRRMFYVSARQGEPFVVERQTSGIGAERIIMQGRPVATPTAVSSDGRWLAVSRGGGGQTQIALVSLADGKIVQVPDATSASNPSFSPDRRWLLYALNIAGRNEVFVRTLPREAGGPAADGKWQISFTGGSQAVWRADGKEILYLAEDGALMAVPVEAGADAFRTGTPTMLFQTDDAASFDVSADGMRILVDQRVVGSSDTPLTVIVNWPSLLRK